MPDAPAAAPAAPAAPATPPPSAPPAAPPPAAPPAGGTPTPGEGTPAKSFDDLVTRAGARREKPAAPPQGKPGEGDGKPQGTPPPEGKPKPDGGPKQLREQLEKVNTELSSSRSTITELQRKIADYEAKGKDTSALAEQLAREQKEKQDLIAQIRALKREASPEFKDKYDKPFNQAAEFAERMVKQLTVTEGDAENPTTRAATWNDFVELYQMPYNKAAKIAKDMFGDAAGIVMQHINDLKKMDFARQEALKEEQTKWKEQEEKDISEQAKQKQFIEETWGKVTQDIANRHPELYLEDPKDPEGNALLKEGYGLVDAHVSTVQDKLIKDAHVRLMAAAVPRLLHRLARLQEQLAEKEAALTEAMQSTPGTTRRPASGGQPSGPKPWKEDLKETMA